jgi:peptide chain release factor subunit 1
MLNERSLRHRLDVLAQIESPDAPILSVYLDLRPGVEEMWTIGARMRDLFHPIREQAADMSHESAENLKSAMDEILAASAGFGSLVGHGVAIFRSPATGLDERVVTPGHMWDRAVAGPRPYLRPLWAVLDATHSVATAVVEARQAVVMVTQLDEVVSYEVIPGETVRKENYAGWYALEESKSRRGAELERHRLFRKLAERLAELRREHDIEALFFGGQARTVDEFLHFLAHRDRKLVAGTFSVDVHTMTDADLRSKAVELSGEWNRERQMALAERIVEDEAAGGLAVTGLPATLAAANRHAIAELIVEGTDLRSGYRCGTCGSLALHGPVCGTCGGVGDPVPDVIDRLVAAVSDSGGEVAYALSPTAVNDCLVGASLRFDIGLGGD